MDSIIQINPLPSIGILPSKEMRGMNDFEDMVSPLTIKPFEEAFTTRWDTDAHFCTYQPADADGEAWPRCNKIFLPKLRVKGLDLHTTVLALDYDTPDHSPWTNASLPVFLTQLDLLATEWPLAWQWSLFYTTRNGARFVYVLDQPIPVDDSEGAHQWLCREFNSRGMKIDLTVSDWTRVYRLPNVKRDGKPTWLQTDPPMEIMWQPENRLSRSILGFADPSYSRGKSEAPAANVIKQNIPKPNPEDVRPLLESSGATGFAKTVWYSLAKRRLQGRECFDCIFEGASLAEKGERDHTIQKFVGQAISMLATLPQTTPEHIYALFLDAVQQLEPDNQTPDWTVTLWNAILRLWSKEEAKIAGVVVAQEHNEQQADAKFKTIARGMREWCNSPILDLVNSDDPADYDKLQQWIERRLIVSTSRGFYLLLGNGYYEPLELQKHQLIMRWRMLGMDDLSASRVPKENGRGYRDVSPEQLLNQHAIVCKEVIGRSCIQGGFIEEIDSDRPRLVVPLFGRNQQLEAIACFDKDVDTWLRHLGGDHYVELTTWIQWALAFEEGPICALSIHGVAGVGKKMLVQGLAECLNVPKIADAKDIVSENQYGLLESPFLVVNEGWPNVPNMHPADRFRHIVGGDSIRANRKYMAPVEIKNPARVIFTANNMEIIRGLTGNRDLSPEDREALFIRILHIYTGDAAAVWLRARGGKAFTGSLGRRWIAGDAGQKSDFIVARHFLWLYQQRTHPPGGHDRLLVQGGKNPEIMFEMRTQSGRAPLILETIFKMIDSNATRDGLVFENGKIYVLTNAVLDFYRENAARLGNERMAIQHITSVLKGLMVKEPPIGGEILQTRQHMGRRRWHELDLELLASVALRDGHHCKKLEKLIADNKKADELKERELRLQIELATDRMV